MLHCVVLVLVVLVPDKVQPQWKTLTLPPLQMSGIGRDAPSISKAVQIPLQLQWGARPVYVYAYVGRTPRNVDLLMGVDVLKFLDAKVDPSSKRVVFRNADLVVPLESVQDNLRRVLTKPISVLTSCSGCNYVYCTLRNLGYSVSHYYSIENDPACRKVTSTIVPKAQLHQRHHDVCNVPKSFDSTHIDLHINTSPCQSFSRLQDAPMGFRDKLRTAPAKAAAKLHRRLKSTNPRIKKLVENVQFHPSLKQDEVKFQSMWGDKFVYLNAKDYGSPSSRPRAYMSDITSLPNLPTVPRLSPNEIFSDCVHCPRPHMRCIVASEKTHSVPTLDDMDTGRSRRLTIAESEVMQGWPPGITDGQNSPMNQSYSTQLRHVGNALNAHQCYQVLREFSTDDSRWETSMFPVSVEYLSSTELETKLGLMSEAERQSWVRERARGWEPERLNLKLKPGQKPHARPCRGYSCQAALIPSMQYMLQEQIDKGYMRKVAYKEGYFVSQGFVQAKPGRFFPGTNIPMVRLLVDCRKLNAACVDAPLHHYDSCPTQADMCSRIPLGSKYFKFYDLSDAFHSCKLTPETEELLVVQFNGEFYQYTGGAQGVANMAVHWNVHLMNIFDRILGEHWEEWYTLYVDDLGVHGMTPEQAEVRG